MGKNCPNCSIDSWEEYQRRIATDEELRRWFSDGRQTNIGIVCGKVSGNLVVVDFDSEDAFNRFYEDNSSQRARPHGTDPCSAHWQGFSRLPAQ